MLQSGPTDGDHLLDDPRDYLETIVLNAKFDKVQAIKYKDEMVFVISEKQYQKLINS